MRHILAFCCALLSMGAFGAESILAPGAELKELAGGFAFTEGPACDRKGNVYFTDQPNDRILKYDVTGRLSVFMRPAGRANGLSFDPSGNLWACADGRNELWCISPSGIVTAVLTNHQGALFNGPNDLWFRPPKTRLRSPADGGTPARPSSPGVFFTDPFYKRNYWNRGPKESPEAVYYLAAGSTRAVRVIDDLKQPNGIIGTPDGRWLYVADIGDRKTYRYRIGEEGGLTDKTLFCERGSDGLTIDSEGNVYTTSQGVFVFSPDGKQIEHIQVPERWTANVCFGGKGRRTLFITASQGLYAIQMRVRGVDSQ